MKKIYFLSLLLLSSFILTAQEKDKEKDSFSFELIADTYFRTNINSTNSNSILNNKPVNLPLDGSEPSASAFANKNGFALGMANAIASYSTNKLEIVADLVVGPRGEEASTSVINQLYVKYSPLENLEFTLGKFNTFLGYEVISAKGNFNYSTSYLFSNGPFSHLGLSAKYNFSDEHSLLFAVMNATDDTNFNNTESFTLGLQYSIKGQNINMLYGRKKGTNADANRTFQIDYTGGIDLSNKFFLGINASYETTKDKVTNKNFGFYGAALYAQYEICPKFQLGLRPEYFSRYVGSKENNTFATTLSGNWLLTKNLRIIPEFRIDYNKDKPFINSKNLPQNTLASFLVSVVYDFKKIF